MDKPNLVKLPREVVYWINVAREDFGDIGMYQPHSFSKAYEIYRWINESDENLKLYFQAIVNGYEVEQIPEDLVREYSKVTLDKANSLTLSDLDSKFYAGEYRGIQKTLSLLNIKISEVNE